MITFNLNIVELIAILGLPSLLTGWILRRYEKKQDKREEAQKDKDVLVIQAVNASIALGEASAIALRNGKCNGETKVALEYSTKIKHELKDFLVKQGVEHLH